jgi:membrane protein DedA with SNARE-associated domain
MGYDLGMVYQDEINQILQSITAHSQPLLDYGSIALFVLLALGILALPVPDETLMVAAGFLIARGKLNFSFTVFAAYMGAICGISLSYLIGRYGGSVLLEKYGHFVRLTKPRIERTRHWFSRIGMWALFIGYFIPGVRHFTGYIVGTVRIPFNRFAIFAFSGAIVWSSTFLTIGFLLGKW